MISSPSISVITATYNAAAVLPQLLDSLRGQTDRGFTWVVVDGGSTDATVDLLKSAPDVVTHWISEPDFGIYHALNKGLAMASGDYYLVLGADDRLAPDALQRYRQAAADSGADVVSGPIHAGGQLVRPSPRLSWINSRPPMVSGHSVGALIRRSLHDELGLYSRKYPIAADTEFLLKVVRAGKRFHFIDEPVGWFGSSGVSSHDVLGGLSESMRAHIQVRGHAAWFFSLFVARVLRHWRRIGRR